MSELNLQDSGSWSAASPTASGHEDLEHLTPLHTETTKFSLLFKEQREARDAGQLDHNTDSVRRKVSVTPGNERITRNVLLSTA